QNRAPYRGKQQHSDHRPLLFTRSASAAIRLSASGEIFSLDIPNSATAVSSTEPLKKVRTNASSAERRASVLTVAGENTYRGPSCSCCTTPFFSRISSSLRTDEYPGGSGNSAWTSAAVARSSRWRISIICDSRRVRAGAPCALMVRPQHSANILAWCEYLRTIVTDCQARRDVVLQRGGEPHFSEGTPKRPRSH